MLRAEVDGVTLCWPQTLLNLRSPCLDLGMPCVHEVEIVGLELNGLQPHC